MRSVYVAKPEPPIVEPEPTLPNSEPSIVELEPTPSDSEPPIVEPEPTLPNSESPIVEPEPTLPNSEPPIVEPEPTLPNSGGAESIPAAADPELTANDKDNPVCKPQTVPTPADPKSRVAMSQPMPAMPSPAPTPVEDPLGEDENPFKAEDISEDDYEAASESALKGFPCCGPCGDWWIRGDYLLWWTSGNRLPPLVTTSPTAVDPPGNLGDLRTTILFGNERVNTEARSGVRTRMGHWLDADYEWGAEAEYFYLGGNTTEFFAQSVGSPVLARPFFNANFPPPPTPPHIPPPPVSPYYASVTVAYPFLGNNIISGAGEIDIRSVEELHSAGAWVRRGFYEGAPLWTPIARCPWDCLRLDWTAGYRYFNLGDNLSIRETEIFTDPRFPLLLGTVFFLQDSFRCRNQFHGGELGLIAYLERGRWSLELTGKVAMGSNRQVVMINGATIAAHPGSPTVYFPAGILALPSNIGTHVSNRFSVIPQLSAEIGHQLSPHVRTHFGYNILYWGSVVRSGDQIDLNINPAQFPPDTGTDPPPYVPFRQSGFWAHGFNAGLEVRY